MGGPGRLRSSSSSSSSSHFVCAHCRFPGCSFQARRLITANEAAKTCRSKRARPLKAAPAGTGGGGSSTALPERQRTIQEHQEAPSKAAQALRPRQLTPTLTLTLPSCRRVSGPEHRLQPTRDFRLSSSDMFTTFSRMLTSELAQQCSCSASWAPA